MSPFHKKPLAYVDWKISQDAGGVKIVQEDNDLLIFFKLVKAGYGTLDDVKKMNVEEVIQALYYEKFLVDYQRACFESERAKA